ncbi:hypothetical protein ABL78_1474 [Leptomonas seymouri]|uniref:Uncharacterized protein n=1 Tax=Leptomonas seymouri TaxID=5684 RepID=A0A0N1I0M8_LEPSE|nr:hypothetical protein ABL78_1474 [Leptomonas seymouri]|eukprot:KPI89438.1 hypothetical protein ABL78_1474 [Leptomonas seymouri]
MPSSSDTLFRLECVLLFALDVVKGPYIHSCAPANPPEVIQSFFQPPAAAPNTGASASTTNASHGFTVQAPLSPQQRKPDAYIDDGASCMSTGAASRKADNTVAGGGCSLSSLSQGSTLCAGAQPFHCTSPLLGVGGAASYPAQCGATALLSAASTTTTSVAVLSSPATSNARAVSSTAIPAPAGTSTTVRTASSSLLAHRRLFGLAETTTITPDDFRGFAMGNSAPNNMSLSEDSNTIFAISPQTNLSESQQTLPSTAPMVGSFASVTNASMTSNTGGGGGMSAASAVAAACLRSYSATGQGADDGCSAASLMARCAGAADDDNNGNSNTPALRSSTSFAPQGCAMGLTGSCVPKSITNAVHSDLSSSPLATPLYTSPVTASSANPGMLPDSSSIASRRASENANAELLLPHHTGYHRGVAGGGGGGGGCRGTHTAAAVVGASPSGAASESGRINSYNDVFVPRSEFCRRVLWLYPAESGLLFLYYAEDIPGEHYQRKTLRYSICLVFCVDKKRMTIGAGLLHQLVRPYSVVLTNIAEELREAEVKYAYMSRGLLQAAPTPRRPPAPRQFDSPVLCLASTATAPTVMGSSTAVDAQRAEPEREGGAGAAEEETADESPPLAAGAAGAGAAAAAVSGAAQKTYRFGRRRLVNESTARPDTYHLALVERGVPATAAASVAPNSNRMNVDYNAVKEQAEHDTHTELMSPPPPKTSRSSADAMADDASPVPQLASTKKEAGGVTEGASSITARKETNPADAKAGPGADASEAALMMTGIRSASGSPLHLAASRTTTGTTPSSRFGTPFSPATQEASRAMSSAGVVAATAVHSNSSGNAEMSSTSASSAVFTNTDTLTVTPSSSLPMRSRTVSQGGGAFQAASSFQSPALFDSASTATTAPSPMTTGVASSGPGGVADPFISAASVHCGKLPLLHSSSAASTASAQGGIAATLCGSGCFPGPHALHNMNPLNAFITPTTPPLWTPLSELVEELYLCLRHSSEGGGEEDTDVSVGTDSTTTFAVPCKGFGRSMNAPPGSRFAYGVWGGSEGGSASVSRQGFATRLAASSLQGKLRHAGGRQLHSPLTAMLSGGGCGLSVVGAVGGGLAEVAQADRHGGGPLTRSPTPPATSYTPGADPPASLPAPPSQQQQRGDVSIVHLSDRLSFHVRRMAPLQAARPLHFDNIPVPIVAYDPSMMEWMDMAMHHVFRLVDGVRTVADIVFDVAMGTTTTLANVYTEALRRCSALAAAEDANAKARQAVGGHAGPNPAANSAAQSSSVGIRDKSGSSRGSSTGNRAAATKRLGAAQGDRPAGTSTGDAQNAAKMVNSNTKGLSQGSLPLGSSLASSRACVVPVPIDARPSHTLLPGVRYSLPTSAAAAAAAAAISDGHSPPPNYVNVRVELPALDPAGAPASTISSASGAALKNSTSSTSLPPSNATAAATTILRGSAALQPRISVELPMTWMATTGIVVEALLHLELCHLIKIYRPWTALTLYSTTQTLQRILRNARHPARQVLAQHLIHVAWMERQQRLLERQARRRSATVRHGTQCERAKKPRQQQKLKEGVDDAAFFLQNASQLLADSHTTSEGAAVSMSLGSPSTTHAHHKPVQCSLKATVPSPYFPTTVGGHVPTTTKEGGGGAAHRFQSEHATLLPAAVAVASSSSSAPKTRLYSDPNALLAQQQFPQRYHAALSVSSVASSLPRPPPSGLATSGFGNAGGLEVDNNTGTHALSCSLKHTVCAGASGKLQMDLTNSLPTPPMLFPVAMNTDRGGGSVQRAMGSQNNQFSFVDVLQPSVDSPYLQFADTHDSHLHQNHVRLLSDRSDGDESNTSLEASSCTDSSSSTSNSSYSSCGSEGGHRTRLDGTDKTGQHAGAANSSPSLSSRSSCSRRESQQASLPVSFKKKSSLCGHRHGGGRTAASSASRTSSATSATSSSPSSPTAGVAHSDHLPQRLITLLATPTLPLPTDALRVKGALPNVELPFDRKDAAAAQLSLLSTEQGSHETCKALLNVSGQGGASASVNPTGVLRVESAASACPPLSAVADFNAKAVQKRKKKDPGPLKQQATPQIFTPTEAELSQAMAAALCALAKFSNTSVASVQAEMRRMPVWAPMFNHWSERCVRAMVEVALLNDWLVDVSQ